MSENKGSIFSRIFGRKTKAPEQPATPPVEQPAQPQAPSLPSAQEDRDQRRQQKNQQIKQAGYQTTVESVQSGLNVQSPVPPVGTELKKSSQQVAAGQTMEQAKDLQERLAPKGTPAERFKRLTENQPKPMPEPVNVSELSEKPVGATPPPTPEQVTKPAGTPPAKKGVNLETDSVPPFVPGSFPGVEKWQPGKGAIDDKAVKEIIQEVNKMPDDKDEKPQEPKLDPVALEKSLKTPTSEWGRKSPKNKQPEEPKKIT